MLDDKGCGTGSQPQWTAHRDSRIHKRKASKGLVAIGHCRRIGLRDFTSSVDVAIRLGRPLIPDRSHLPNPFPSRLRFGSVYIGTVVLPLALYLPHWHL